MATIFLEIICRPMPPDERHLIEADLDAALSVASAGEVTGGGSGGDTSTIEVEITELGAGLSVIRSVLRGFDLGEAASIKQYEPVAATHSIRGRTPEGDS